METKTFEVIESPGIIRDFPAHKLVEAAFTDGQNFHFPVEGAESLSGNKETFSEASITPLWLWPFPPLVAPKWVYADLNQVFVVDGTTHTEITRVSGNYSALASERWSACVFNGVGILNNGQDLPQAWSDFDPTTKLIDLTNWDATRRAKVIRPFKNFLVALNLTDSGVERPYRILWSDSAVPGTLPGSWDSTDPATDSREFDLAQTSDHLVDCLPMGEINIIYKEASTWGMSAIGPPYYFRFWEILSKTGLLHRDCVAATPIGHIVVTIDDIILHNGQPEQSKSIIDSKLRKWLFSSIDPTNFKNSFAFADVKNNEFHFCFPEIDQIYATKDVTWNWKKNSFGIKDLSPTPFMTVGPIGESQIDDLIWDPV